jgi:hypothetical protein
MVYSFYLVKEYALLSFVLFFGAPGVRRFLKAFRCRPSVETTSGGPCAGSSSCR